VAEYAETTEEAAARFQAAQENDPFPQVPPALLNSGDIARYVAATGMIFPFREEEEHLKPASYEVPLAGQYVYWDESGARHAEQINTGGRFMLKPNSIAFVTLEPYFRIPIYIALRFNLRISHIYKGILLGTGPLVDPGFQGYLSIPLHNLTTNEYEFLGGEGLIWMEFTKVSPLAPSERAGAPVFKLPLEKQDLTLDEYLHKATGGRPVMSSIPKAGEEARTAARESADAARRSEQATKRTSQFVTTALVVAVVLGFVSAVAALASIWTLINSTNARFDQLSTAARATPGLSTPSLLEEVQNLESTVSTLREDMWRWVLVVIISVIVVAVLAVLVHGSRHEHPEESA
jgi:deoxycytidine triphosphate deaminase